MKKLVSTAGLDKKEWLLYRKQGIGGSDAGAICGLNSYRTAMQVYLDKTSEEVEEIDNEAMLQGRDFEDYVARRFMKATGKKVRRANAMYYDEKHLFMLADVDRMVVGENAGLECKTASPYVAYQWEDGKIPLSYQLQCYHYMSVCNADKGLLDLAYRNPEMQIVQAHEVYENDEFDYELGMNPKLVHKPTLGDRGELRLFYGMFRLTNGGFGFEVMSKTAVEAYPVYLRLMVIDTNSDPDKVKPEELLSDQVYLYERKTGKVRIA